MRITRIGRQLGLSWSRTSTAAAGSKCDAAQCLEAASCNSSLFHTGRSGDFSTQGSEDNIEHGTSSCHAGDGWHVRSNASTSGSSEHGFGSTCLHGSAASDFDTTCTSSLGPTSHLTHSQNHYEPSASSHPSTNRSSILRSPVTFSVSHHRAAFSSSASLHTNISHPTSPSPLPTPASPTLLSAPSHSSPLQPLSTRGMVTKRPPPTRKRSIMLGDPPAGTRPDARRLVAPDCRFLLTYKKTIPHAQLTYRLAKRSEIDDIRDMVALYAHQMDVIAVATALSRLAAAQRSAAANSVLTPAFTAAAADTLARLHTRLEEQLQWGSLAPISAAMWSLSQLASPEATPRDLTLALLTKAVSSRTKMVIGQPHRLSVMVWALPRLLSRDAHSDPRVITALDRVALISLKNIAKFSPQALANLAQGFSKLCPRLDSHLTAAGQRHPFDPPTSASSTRNNIWTGVSSSALVSSDAPSSSKATAAVAAAASVSGDPAAERTMLLFDGIAVEVIGRLGNYSIKQLQPRDYCGLLDAFAKAKYRHEPLFASLATSATSVLHTFQPNDMRHLAHAFASAGVRNARLFSVMQQLVLEQLPAWNAQSLAALNHSLRKLGLPHQGLEDALQRMERGNSGEGDRASVRG